MKYIVTENQLKVLIKEDRVAYLKTQNVIDKKLLDDNTEGSDEKDGKRPEGGMQKKVKIEAIQGHDGVDIAYIVTNKKGKTSIKLTEEIFDDIVESDPTQKKEFVQWMIQVFGRHIKDKDIDQAVRFLTEDLPEANEYLGVFDNVRKKKVFKTGAPNRPNAPQNVSDINQYTDLAHLYSVVSPFIGADEDDGEGGNPLWNKMKKYIDLGHARLAYRDNGVLVYTPQTIESSCEPLGNLASWCTRREGNSYFDSYRKNNPKPDGTLSDYYVVMPKELFDGDDGGGTFPLQFHFESGQLHDKNNRSIERDKLPEIVGKYGGLKNFFKEELGALATEDIRQGSGLMDSRYIKYLAMFGGKAQDVITDEVYQAGVESIRREASEDQGPLQNNRYLKWLMEHTDGVLITDYLNKDMDVLDFSNMPITELPDLSEFKNATRISANKCGLERIPPADYLPNDIEILTMTDNKIKEVPLPGYEKLTKCFVMNFAKNPITKINIAPLEKLVRENLARFVLVGVDLDKLSPANRKAYDAFEADPDGIGYLTA